MTETTLTHRNIRYRLIPGTCAKAAALSRLAGATRFEGRILRIWNHFLAANREAMQAYREGQGDKPKGGFAGSVSFYGLGKQFTALRRDTPWLQELSFAPVRYVLKRQEAFERSFDGGGYPRFKSRRGGDSVTLPDQVRIDGDRLWVPKLGWYRFRRRDGNPTDEDSRFSRIPGGRAGTGRNP